MIDGWHRIAIIGTLATFVAGCSAGSGGIVSPAAAALSVAPTAAASVQARFMEGSPALEILIPGSTTPVGLGSAYLVVDNMTIASQFPYGTMTRFATYAAGTQSVRVLDSLGYEVGPLRTPALVAGKSYSIVLVGTYPKYELLAFEEPPHSTAATLSVYNASPSLAHADYGSFSASTHSNFRKLGSAGYGEVATLALKKAVSNFGAYAGTGTTPITGGSVTLKSVDSFDTRNALPFHNATRLSLFVLDPLAGSTTGPVFGLDL